jgi:hypothetical protein
VCEFLLRNFADANGTLWIYDSLLGKSRDGNTRSAGFERDLYALTLRDRGRDYAHLEKALADRIDAPGAEALQRLVSRKQCTGPQWMNFLGFVAAQMIRTPAYFDRLIATNAPMMQEMLERMAKFDAKFRAGVQSSMAELGGTPADVEKQIAAAGAGRYRVHPNREWIVANAIQQIPDIHSELREMHWTFLEVSEGEPDLIIGDSPVMLVDLTSEPSNPKPIGLRNPGIELAMPLSRRMVAVARRDGPDSFGDLAKGMSDLLNIRTLSYARRFIFAANHSDDLLKRAVELRGSGPKVHIRRVRVGKGLGIVSIFQ